MKKRVVITGIGIYSSIGKNIEEVTKSLYEGRSGIGIDPERTAYGYRSSLTGILERPKLKGLLERRLRISLAEQGEYAYMGYIEMLKHSNSIKLGFVGMIKEMSILRAPHLGEVLNTTISVIAEIFHTTLVKAKIEVGSEIIATCEMKIYLSDIEHQNDKTSGEREGK